MIVIALGANIPSRAGMPRDTLNAALTALREQGIRIAAISSFYATPAWPDPGDPPFVNAVARIETGLSPPELMTLLHATEESFGRQRTKKNAPRTLDLDLLDYDGRIEVGPPVLPHPRLGERSFVLIPLADIAPLWRHPATKASLAELIEALPPNERQITRLEA